MVAILYNIRSVHNTGSIFRTADAAGVEKLYLCGTTPSPLDRFGKKRQDFVKVSLGAEDSVAWEKVLESDTPLKIRGESGVMNLIQNLKHDGYTIISLEQHETSIPHYSEKIKFKNNIALIVGNEVEGLPQDILDASDHIIEIPMRGAMVREPRHPKNSHDKILGKESLNVSVAFGIAAYQLQSSQQLDTKE
jgi:23S rRNA (guanosine2251-2'-O)-methyltransferase